MTVPVSRPVARLGRFGRLWWLPAGGHGNGLDDCAWAPVLQVSGQIVGASAYGRAEAVLLAVMPRLAREAAGRGDTAWR
jgi:hypothetical protein